MHVDMLPLYMVLVLVVLGSDSVCYGPPRSDGRCGYKFSNSKCPVGLCCNTDGYCSQSCPSGSQCILQPHSCVASSRLDLRCGPSFQYASCPQGHCCSMEGRCTTNCTTSSICPPPRVCQLPPRNDLLCGHQHGRASCSPGLGCDHDGRCRATCSEEALCPILPSKEPNRCGRRARHDLRCGPEYRRAGCPNRYCCDNDNICKESCSVHAICHHYKAMPPGINMTRTIGTSSLSLHSLKPLRNCPVRSSEYYLLSAPSTKTFSKSLTSFSTKSSVIKASSLTRTPSSSKMPSKSAPVSANIPFIMSSSSKEIPTVRTQPPSTKVPLTRSPTSTAKSSSTKTSSEQAPTTNPPSSNAPSTTAKSSSTKSSSEYDPTIQSPSTKDHSTRSPTSTAKSFSTKPSSEHVSTRKHPSSKAPSTRSPTSTAKSSATKSSSAHVFTTNLPSTKELSTRSPVKSFSTKPSSEHVSTSKHPSSKALSTHSPTPTVRRFSTNLPSTKAPSSRSLKSATKSSATTSSSEHVPTTIPPSSKAPSTRSRTSTAKIFSTKTSSGHFSTTKPPSSKALSIHSPTPRVRQFSTKTSSTKTSSADVPSTNLPSTKAPSTRSPTFTSKSTSTKQFSEHVPTTTPPSSKARSTRSPTSTTKPSSTKLSSAHVPTTKPPSSKAPSTRSSTSTTKPPSAKSSSGHLPTTNLPSTKAPSSRSPTSTTKPSSTKSSSAHVPTTKPPSSKALSTRSLTSTARQSFTKTPSAQVPTTKTLSTAAPTIKSPSTKTSTPAPVPSTAAMCPGPAEMSKLHAPPRTKCVVGARRNILSLSDDELTAYRDAIRLNYRCGSFRCPWIDGPFMSLANDHVCNWDRCPHGNSLFLPWHRRYLLRMETLLCNAIPYWDFSSSDTQFIPKAFSDSTYVSNGTTYPNPLFNGFLRDGSYCSRSPDSSVSADIKTKLAVARGKSQFSDFTSTLEDAHNQAHNSVGGCMEYVSTASYDPIFWSLHMFVDYQWYKWQVLHPSAVYPSTARGQMEDSDGSFLGFDMISRTSDWERLTIASTFSTQTGFKMVSGSLQIIVTVTKIPITSHQVRVDLVSFNVVLGSSLNLATGQQMIMSSFRNATFVVSDAYQSLVNSGKDPDDIESSAKALLVDQSTNASTPVSGDIFWEWLTVYQ